MYCGSRVFSAIAASPLLLAGDDQFAGGNNSRMVGSLRSVIDRFSSSFSGGAGDSLAGAGSGAGSLNSCSFLNSTAFFGVVTPLPGSDLFTRGVFFFAMIAGVRELRVGACCVAGGRLNWSLVGALDSSSAGSKETLIFSCGARRIEVCDQSSRTARWIAKDAAKNPASDREAYSTTICYRGNLCLSKSRGCNEIDW
jgi:hypothetical protein